MEKKQQSLICTRIKGHSALFLVCHCSTWFHSGLVSMLIHGDYQCPIEEHKGHELLNSKKRIPGSSSLLVPGLFTDLFFFFFFRNVHSGPVINFLLNYFQLNSREFSCPEFLPTRRFACFFHFTTLSQRTSNLQTHLSSDILNQRST